MNKREKIVVGAALTGALVGGFMMVGDLRDRRDEETDPALALAEVETYVAEARAALVAAGLSSAERRALESAGRALTMSPIDERPFVRVAAVVATKEEKEGVPAFVYSAYIAVGDRAFAVINGREYRAGDVVDGSTFVVRAIAADHVLLEQERSGREQRVPIQDKLLRGR